MLPNRYFGNEYYRKTRTILEYVKAEIKCFENYLKYDFASFGAVAIRNERPEPVDHICTSFFGTPDDVDWNSKPGLRNSKTPDPHHSTDARNDDRCLDDSFPNLNLELHELQAESGTLRTPRGTLSPNLELHVELRVPILNSTRTPSGTPSPIHELQAELRVPFMNSKRNSESHS